VRVQECVPRIKINAIKVQDILVNLFLIILGIFLLILQIDFEILSAFLLGGLLFTFLGIYGLVLTIYNHYTEKQTKKQLEDAKVINIEPIVHKKAKENESQILRKICPRCGEKYPEDTIHTKCILCDTPL
jgi:hypothetical protein